MKINIKWQTIIAILSLIIITVYLALAFIPSFSSIKNYPLLFMILIGGVPLLARIVIDLCKGNFGADLLAVLALITAVFLEEYLAANLIIFMLASGQALEEYALRKASSVLSALAARMPSKAHLKTADGILEVDVNQIKIGDKIIIYPHENCPVDGVVIEGHSKMDESYLTGEPYQISKAPGSVVLSGAVNGESVLVVLAEKLVKDSHYAKIIKVMEDAERRRPRLRRLADQIGMIFTPIALITALSAWYFSGDLVRFLAVLVVATPCPLLIAIPITIISAISLSARRGIIIKDPTVLERLPTCRTAVFDKTGTLTYGRPELTKIISASEISDDMILQKAASLERYSRHPLAIAILEEANKRNLSLLEADSVSEKPGHGLSGMVSHQRITVTNREKLLAIHPDLASALPTNDTGLECMMLIDDKYAATLCFHDKMRKDGQPFITHLTPSHKFNRIILLSGDRESEVNYMANLLGIAETYSSQSPGNKLLIVRAETKKAPTLFMGDGINDAPALAAATVGIAFGQQNSVTSESAGAVILENTLVKVDELLHISESMRHIAAQSAIGGMLLSFIGMGFAAAGMISPVNGALLQEAIDVLAIINALRMTWQPGVAVDIKLDH